MLDFHIHKKLGSFTLDIEVLTKAKRIGILGASGCGKSMTLRCLAGIERPDDGYICLGDRTVYSAEKKICIAPQKRKVGYLFQHYALFPTMTVEQNIAAGLHGTKQENAARVQEMIDTFQLSGLEKKLPGQLSGGQQQRTALARIMAYEPEVILLDEPFSALDAFLKDRLQQELMEMLKSYEGTVVLVSHSRDEIYRFSEELLIMADGHMICQGKTKEVFANPGYKEAARLTGCKNITKSIRKNAHELEIPAWGTCLTLQEGDNRFHIFNIEKTVVDIVYYRNRVGIEETAEILKNYLKRTDRQIDRLFAYAKQLRCEKVVRTYLEVLI